MNNQCQRKDCNRVATANALVKGKKENNGLAVKLCPKHAVEAKRYHGAEVEPI